MKKFEKGVVHSARDFESDTSDRGRFASTCIAELRWARLVLNGHHVSVYLDCFVDNYGEEGLKNEGRPYMLNDTTTGPKADKFRERYLHSTAETNLHQSQLHL